MVKPPYFVLTLSQVDARFVIDYTPGTENKLLNSATEKIL